MSVPTAYRSRYFYFAWLGLWLISLRLFGGQGIWVVPGMLLFFSPGFIVGDKLIGRLERDNPAPLISAILIGIVLSGFALFFAGKIAGFNPFINIAALVMTNLAALVFFNTFTPTEEIKLTPTFDYQDYYPLLGALVFLVIFVLPAYYNVGRLTSNGYAYAPWFSLDFLWSKTYAVALSHGEIPARNPFYPKFTLRYHYWLHVLPAYLYQLTSFRINFETLLLLLYFLADAVFLVSVYLLFCEKLKTHNARIVAMVLLLIANSFEGSYFLYLSLGRQPLSSVLLRNLEMRFIPSLLTPYLHLLYIVPHLFTAAYFYLLYQLLSKRRSWADYLMAGLIIGAATGMSIFMGAFLIWYCLLIFVWKKLWRQHKFWLRLATFIGGALLINMWLVFAVKMYSGPDLTSLKQSLPKNFTMKKERTIFGQADRAKLPLNLYGLGRFSLSRRLGSIGPYVQIGAECLPSLVFLVLGLYVLYQRKSLNDLSVEITFVLSCLFAYFFISTNEFSRTISHKVSLPIYIFSAYLGGVVFEAGSAKVKKIGWGLLVVFLVLSIPTLLINFYHVNNLDNPKEVTYLSPQDYAATQWMKKNLPTDAIIQSFPNYPAWPHPYSLIPMFAERNTGVGAIKGAREALNFQQLAVFEQNKVMAIYSAKLPIHLAKQLLKAYRIDYLYFGPLEMKAFGPDSLRNLHAQKDLYQIVYQNMNTVIFQVKGS